MELKALDMSERTFGFRLSRLTDVRKIGYSPKVYSLLRENIYDAHVSDAVRDIEYRNSTFRTMS